MFNNVGRVWTPDTFRDYLTTIPLTALRWFRGVCFHHTWFPSLSDRPDGFKANHIANMRDFYRTKGWKSGPHLYADDDQLWGMSELQERGVHAVSFNAEYIGIEVLGNFDIESPYSGRGSACWFTAMQAALCLLDRAAIPLTPEAIKFHRDDPQTSKSCPGNLVKKEWVLQQMQTLNLPLRETPAPARDLKMVSAICRANQVPCNLHVVGGQIKLNGVVLYTAVYDRHAEATFADLKEIEHAISNSK